MCSRALSTPFHSQINLRHSNTAINRYQQLIFWFSIIQEFWKKLGNLGLLGITAPSMYGNTITILILKKTTVKPVF